MSLPREVHEVLEQEYVSMYGPLPLSTARYDKAQLQDPKWARSILRTCDLAFDELADEVLLEKLNSYVTTRPPAELLLSPALTSAGRALLEQYNTMNDAITEDGELEVLNRRIVDDAFTGAVISLRDVRLKRVYDALHRAAREEDRPRTALCISGGGIRSATFALGVVQGLASARILDKFDYLSTVSGGGYIGAWLSSWARRSSRGMTGVQDSLALADTGVGGTRPAADEELEATRLEELPAKIDPEPKPVRHLREYSNYLSPRLGLLSGDTWTMAALYVRNVLLNLLVLVPILAAILALPRLFAYLASRTNEVTDVAYAWSTVFFLTWAFGYVGFKRPVDGAMPAKKLTKMSADLSYVIGCALPLTLAAVSLSLFWADVNHGRELFDRAATFDAAVAGLIAMTVVPFITYYIRVLVAFFKSWRTTHASLGSQVLHLSIKGLQEMIGTVAGLATAVLLFFLLALKIFPEPMQALWPLLRAAHEPPALRAAVSMVPVSALYVCFAVPAVMLVFFVQATIFVGISSHRNEDHDREWWGRAGAWGLIISAAWIVLSGIAVFGPIAIYHAPVLLASVGGLAGVAAALLGFSAKTAANKHEKEQAGVAGTAGNLALTLAVPLFVAFLLASISQGTTWLTYHVRPLVTLEDKVDWAEYEKAAQLSSVIAVTTTPASTFDFATPPLNRRPQPLFSPLPKGPVTQPRGPNVVTREIIDQSAAAPRISIPLLKSLEHLRMIRNTQVWELCAFGILAMLSWVLSTCIGVNKFSMHALYRNRLIRAYLGASRYSRNPHPFTGFDEKDNLAMNQLRAELLWPSSVKDAKQLIDTMREASTNGTGGLEGHLLQRRILAQHLWGRFYRKTRLQIGNHVTSGMIDAVVQNLNVLIANERTRFEDVPNLQLPASFWATMKRDDQVKYPVVMRNRAVLDYCFDGIIEKMPRPISERTEANEARRPPMHVVNIALNLVAGEKLAWQQRKAESFTCSPYHSGSMYLGYRPSHEYGGPEGISAGTAVTISGAAASPNMGYHSSPALAFLLTLFNIRLGWWLGNPGPVGQKVYKMSHPGSNLAPMLAEAAGRTNDSYDWVYLSDGGHFENLGLYEMVLRRCHYIVLSDAGADPQFAFEDLGNAIRKIRTDLGVPIDIEHMFMFPRTAGGQEKEGRYVATATIRYTAVDGATAKNGTLIYIKPGVYKDRYFPRDVYNYAQACTDFPHEGTGDQFFSESQFESYRALGRHAVNEICCNYTDPNPPEAKMPIAKQFKSVAEFAQFVEKQADLTATTPPEQIIAEAIRTLKLTQGPAAEA
ncbi:MAG TPA: patatin-like phospholipase family protein [Thermoanaerobaculia bacterium]|nr:patatin-like phospholipase family protein [Thermoanaerobaculia bacterium]